MESEALVEFGKPLERIKSNTPTPEGKEVLLKITHGGVCHSDVHIQDGYFDLGGGNQLPLGGTLELPHTLGHEIEGEVVSIGPEVKNIEVGENVVAFPWIGCGDCPTCSSGDEHYCNAPRQLGIQIPGGFSDFCLVPDEKYLLDYTGINPGLAATYMCSGLTAFGALKKLVNINDNDHILILGLGGVGMMGLQFARALFNCKILAADIDPNKLQAAQGAGADEVYNTSDELSLMKLIEDTKGGVKAAVDFVGAEKTIQFAFDGAKKGGQIVVVGLFGGSFEKPIPMFPLMAKSICGSFVGNLEETKEMLDLVKSGKVDPIPVQTRNLTEATKTLDDLREGNITGRVVLEP